MRRGLRSLSAPLGYAAPAVLIALVLLVVNGIMEPGLVRPENWASTLAVMTPFILVSLAQVPPVMSGNGGIDLSVGPAAGLVNVVVVAQLVPHGLDSPLEVVPIALGIGAAIGLVNGLMVAYVRIPAIVATLGTYLILGGLAIEVLPIPGGSAPHWLTGLSGQLVGPVPEMVLVLLAVALVWTALQRTAFRRNLLATGGDARAAYTAGVNVPLIQLLAFVCAGVLSAVAGLAFVSELGSGDPTIGTSYTLISIAGVALGGVTLAGGRGGLLGAAAGGAFLFLVQNTLGLLGVNVFYTQVAYGVALLLALAANSVADRRRKRGRSSAGPHSEPVEAIGLLGQGSFGAVGDPPGS